MVILSADPTKQMLLLSTSLEQFDGGRNIIGTRRMVRK